MTQAAIKDALAEYGRCHTFGIRTRPDDQTQPVTVSIDKYVPSMMTFQQTLHFRPLGDQWREISQVNARYILTKILAFDLAYNSPDMNKPLADAIGESFLDTFEKDARYFTNGRFTTRLSSWNQLTETTFDSGVVAIDSTLISTL